MDEGDISLVRPPVTKEASSLWLDTLRVFERQPKPRGVIG